MCRHPITPLHPASCENLGVKSGRMAASSAPLFCWPWSRRDQRGADTGLSNQGWKDSEDSIFHADGRQPEGPIALVEVQGYAFAAFRAACAGPLSISFPSTARAMSSPMCA